MTDTPFQRWFGELLEEQGWGVREAARRLGLTASTASLYRAGKMLPDVERQRRLAEAAGAPVEQVARLVWESQDARRAGREALPGKPNTATAFRSRRRWRYRFRPLGIAFTMSRTRAVQEDSLARLYALATARRRSIEATLDEALRLALPLMERRRPSGGCRGSAAGSGPGPSSGSARSG
jgi:transcriptional regulator with XRE-family HTH domain